MTDKNYMKRRFKCRCYQKDNTVKIYDGSEILFDVSYRDFDDAFYLGRKLQSVIMELNDLHEEKEQLQSRINDYDVALKTLQDLTERKLKENEQLKTKNNVYIQDIEVFKEENTHLKLENEMLKNGVVHYNLLKEDIETVLNYIGTNIVLNFARNDDTYSLNDRERLAYIRLTKSIGKGYDDVDLEKW